MIVFYLCIVNLHLLHATQGMSVIWIGLFLCPVAYGWWGYPVITAVGLDPCCPGGPLSAPDPGGLFAPFLSCLAQH